MLGVFICKLLGCILHWTDLFYFISTCIKRFRKSSKVVFLPKYLIFQLLAVQASNWLNLVSGTPLIPGEPCFGQILIQTTIMSRIGSLCSLRALCLLTKILDFPASGGPSVKLVKFSFGRYLH